jgi:hypothetical protein
VPDAAAKSGKVKITITFPAWKEREFEPATFEVPIVDRQMSQKE